MYVCTINPLTAKCNILYNYAKIKTEVLIEYDSSLLGELYSKFSSIIGSNINISRPNVN